MVSASLWVCVCVRLCVTHLNHLTPTQCLLAALRLELLLQSIVGICSYVTVRFFFAFVPFCVTVFVSICVCRCVDVLCCVFINRCQCGAVLAAQSETANMSQMSEEKDGERVIECTKQNQKEKERTLAEPQPSYLLCPCTLCPFIIDLMYGERCVELQAVILKTFCAKEAHEEHVNNVHWLPNFVVIPSIMQCTEVVSL